MAAGDTWTVTTQSGLNIRTGPGTNYTKVSALSYGATITEISSSNGWIQFDGGWVSSSFMSHTPAPTTTVTTTTENSPATSGGGAETTTGGSGYQPSTDYILTVENSSLNVSTFSRISSVAGVFGLPAQFLPLTDPRINNSSSDIELGYEYADKIISRIPLLLMAPGKPSFMTEYSAEDKANVLERIINTATGNVSTSSLEDLLDDDGRYYTFEYDQARYYTFVNPMCRIAARYLDIQDFVIDGQRLDSINWETFTQQRIRTIGDFGDFSSVPFYVDADTSISESHSNSTTQSMIASTVNSISDMGRELNFLLGYGASATGVDALNDADVAANIENVNSIVSKLMGSGNFLSNLASHLTTVAAGGKLIFPDIWSDSQFSRSYNCEFKFISPDPSNLSIYLNVLVPLFHLLGFVCPQSIDSNPNGYTSPFLVRAIYKGFFNVDMGIITDMSVTKGAECQWTPEGIPTSITVSITIKDLYQAMSITPTSAGNLKYDTLNNTALMDYIANLCGINIYKPEITRMIEMWYINNFNNRVSDFFKVNIWQGIKQNIQNIIMNIYR